MFAAAQGPKSSRRTDVFRLSARRVPAPRSRLRQVRCNSISGGARCRSRPGSPPCKSQSGIGHAVNNWLRVRASFTVSPQVNDYGGAAGALRTLNEVEWTVSCTQPLRAKMRRSPRLPAMGTFVAFRLLRIVTGACYIFPDISKLCCR
ncbi:hypothetical protein BRAS3843_2880027 [Bradyrhizobium sp. STM 3843]|nr:hypothetical protein BRAS3843_2880027 [Bradyrhizobium sp. STM 3843]